MADDELLYYTHPGFVTDPGEHAGLFDELPGEIPALCRVVQGLLLHVFWAERYGVTLTEEREQEVEIRRVSRMLARMREMDPRPLTVGRALENKLVGNCRDFSVLMCAMLRHRGVPARARCGFGAYFEPDHYEDHWVCEYWNAGEGRWVMVDAQLDALQREVLQIPFDPCDVPRDQFLVGGKAWRMCRAGEANPDHFGIFDMHGMGFIRGDLVRDFLALNKIEVLPWDGWGVMVKPGDALSPDDVALLDRIAALTLVDVPPLAEVRAIYKEDRRLHMPPSYAVDPERFDVRRMDPESA
jgi:hypothetical protein